MNITTWTDAGDWTGEEDLFLSPIPPRVEALRKALLERYEATSQESYSLKYEFQLLTPLSRIQDSLYSKLPDLCEYFVVATRKHFANITVCKREFTEECSLVETSRWYQTFEGPYAEGGTFNCFTKIEYNYLYLKFTSQYTKNYQPNIIEFVFPRGDIDSFINFHGEDGETFREHYTVLSSAAWHYVFHLIVSGMKYRRFKITGGAFLTYLKVFERGYWAEYIDGLTMFWDYRNSNRYPTLTTSPSELWNMTGWKEYENIGDPRAYLTSIEFTQEYEWLEGPISSDVVAKGYYDVHLANFITDGEKGIEGYFSLGSIFGKQYNDQPFNTSLGQENKVTPHYEDIMEPAGGVVVRVGNSSDSPPSGSGASIEQMKVLSFETAISLYEEGTFFFI